MSLDGEESPRARHPLEIVQAPVAELDSRAGHQILDGAGYQNLSRHRHGHDPGGDVNSDAAHTVSALAQLDLSGVQPGADLDAESTY